jgi:hypothetical protein
MAACGLQLRMTDGLSKKDHGNRIVERTNRGMEPAAAGEWEGI